MSEIPSIIVHGGVAYSAKDPLIIERIESCRKAARVGYEKLMRGGSAVEAVEAAIRWLEDDELLNCGYGSVLNEFGDVQMDASIMTDQKCGSVACVSRVDHPISVAKYILENVPNYILIERAAENLAEHVEGVTVVSKDQMISPAAFADFISYIPEDYKKPSDSIDSLKEKKEPETVRIVNHLGGSCSLIASDRLETVGCVAWDGKSMASGSSTGGLSFKRQGRVGDSPLMGCGIFADDQFGVSLTGHGESVIGTGLSRQLAKHKRRGCHTVFETLKDGLDYVLDNTGRIVGAIALADNGDWGSYFTGTRMPFCYINETGEKAGMDLQEGGS